MAWEGNGIGEATPSRYGVTLQAQLVENGTATGPTSLNAASRPNNSWISNGTRWRFVHVIVESLNLTGGFVEGHVKDEAGTDQKVSIQNQTAAGDSRRYTVVLIVPPGRDYKVNASSMNRVAWFETEITA